MSQVLTRRSLVVAAPAAVAVATLPAIANATGAHLDATLLALREPYERTLAGIAAASLSRDPADPDALFDAAVDANTDVINQIAETPARTMEGLLFKAQVAARESYDMDVAASIVTDLMVMGGLDA